MNLEAELARLRAENARLRRLLDLTQPPQPSQTGLFLERPGPVTAASSAADKVRFFRRFFAARPDVYAKRYENRRTGRSGWVPAVEGGWRKGTTRPYLRPTDAVVESHLIGDVHMGLYPMLRDDTCHWLAADFDGPPAMLDGLSYLKAARAVGVPAALEVSRSGTGAHVVADAAVAVGRGRHCLVLTQWTSHVDALAGRLRDGGLDPVVLKGGMGVRERAAAFDRLRPEDGPLLVVATGPYVGEGFDCPALDTLFLAAPIAFKGRLVQYVGRVLRSAPGKVVVEVHDYHDVHTPVLASSLAKRMPGYRSLGFPDPRSSR